jgi:hypothetical protein
MWKKLNLIMLFVVMSFLSNNGYADTLSGAVSKINYEKRTFSLAKKSFYLPEYVVISLIGDNSSKLDFSSLTNGMEVEVAFSKRNRKPQHLRSIVLLLH